MPVTAISTSPGCGAVRGGLCPCLQSPSPASPPGHPGCHRGNWLSSQGPSTLQHRCGGARWQPGRVLGGFCPRQGRAEQHLRSSRRCELWTRWCPKQAEGEKDWASQGTASLIPSLFQAVLIPLFFHPLLSPPCRPG